MADATTADVATDSAVAEDAAAAADGQPTGVDGTKLDTGDANVSDAAPDSGAFEPDSAANDADSSAANADSATQPLGSACDPCQIADDCAAGLACVSYGAAVGAFCAAACGDDGTCVAGYACAGSKTLDGKALQACMLKPAADGSAAGCACSPQAKAAKAKTLCSIGNSVGKCTGVRSCAAEGLSACSAATPAAEMCDGLDNDCDGQLDETSCDDSNVCTSDACDPASGCTNAPVDGNPACSDDTACTSGDTCTEGQCQGQLLKCADNNSCTLDSCAVNSGCVHLPITASCSDADACTQGDSCLKGLCAGKPINCDDDSVCTDDSCDASLGCINLAAGITCSDDNSCTATDTCQGGACFGKFVDCEDDNACTADTCDANIGCVHSKLPFSGPCDDGSICTTADACAQGVCVGKPAVCDDKKPCTADSCKPPVGCTFVAVVDGKTCDDSNACTQADLCGSGACTGKTIACVDGNPCTDDKCDKISGCVFAPNAVTCTDANTCTAKDSCKSGTCSGVATACSDGNACTADSCVPGSGCVYTKLASGACNDGNPCTSGDACKVGICTVGTLVTDCGDSNPCTADACDKLSGCLHLPAVATCTDSNPCTLGDSCGSGVCLPGGATKNCNDANVCTSDTCDGKLGCVNAAKAGPCNDSSSCTTGEACAKGLCTPLLVTVCDDKNACTDDSCTTATGLCKYAVNAKPCNDGIACTSGDVCALGKCSGKSIGNLWSAYIGPSSAYHYGAVARAGADFVVLANAMNGATGANTAVAVKVDASGKVLWQSVFGTKLGPYPLKIAALVDGTLLAAYTTNAGLTNMDIEVTKLDAAGKVLWTKNLGEPNPDWPQGLVAFADGSFALAEHHSFAQPTAQNLVVSKYSAIGTKVWTSALGSVTFIDEVQDLVATPGGAVVAVGYTMSKGAGLSDGWLVKLEAATGKTLLDLTFGGAQHDRLVKVVAMADGGFAAVGTTRSKGNLIGAGDFWIVRTDSLGKVGWERTYGPSLKQVGYSGLEVDSPVAALTALLDGGLALLAKVDDASDGNTDWRVLRLTAKGDLVWTKVYGETATDAPWQVLGLENDQLLLAGAHLFPANSDIRPWLLRTDAWGNADCAKSGLCATVNPAKCGDDGNPCTDDGCEAVKGCVKVNNALPCAADGIACTPDVCSAGVCSAALPVHTLCDDKKPWTADVCTKVTGCTYTCTDVTTAKPAQRVTVPAGNFWMGCNSTTDQECSAAEKPQHEVTLSQYDIDVFEVTVAQFKACVSAGKCTLPSNYNALCNYAGTCKDQHPVNCVMWSQAAAYCAFAGGRLPTEAEWEKAGRGGCEKYPNQDCAKAMPKYPWGSTWQACTTAVTANGCGIGSTAAVGSKPAGKSIYGVHDLIGNVLEWVGDYYGATYFATSPALDPKGPLLAAGRVVKGGAFANYLATQAEQRTGTRADYSAGHYGYGAGFRCVVPKP